MLAKYPSSPRALSASPPSRRGLVCQRGSPKTLIGIFFFEKKKKKISYFNKMSEGQGVPLPSGY